MPLRGVRGATRLAEDDPAEMRDAVVELIRDMLERNRLAVDDVVSVIFTTTPDLVSAFPASFARELGFADVPLLCASEIDVRGALARVVRVLMHVEADGPRWAVQHVYLRGAEVLRQDLAQ